jgi:hypothetical protein
MPSHSERFTPFFFNAVILVFPLLASGCSFSHSSESVSDSVESLSDALYSSSDSLGSSSDSSKSDREKKYENEVADYTTAYVKSSRTDGDYNSYQKGLSDIAAKKGINNWEQEPKTYIAIGKGLKKAGLDGAAFETYKKNLAGSDPEKMQNIQKGYDSRK